MYSSDGYVHAQDTVTVEGLKKNFGLSERQIAAMYSHFAWIIYRLMLKLGDDGVGKSYDPLSINYKNGMASSYLFTPYGRGFGFRDWEHVEEMLEHAILEIGLGFPAETIRELAEDIANKFR